jgi:kynureninase
MPRAVYGNLQTFADAWVNKGILAWEDWTAESESTKARVGRLIGARDSDIALHQNVSTLLSILISALDFSGKRNKVVVSDLNFPSLVYNWMECRRLGARIEVVKSRDGLTVHPDDVVAALDDETLVCALDLVFFRSGALLDARPIIEAAQEKGAWVLLDVYQAVGAVPFDIRQLEVDFALGGSVKFMCGGPGLCWLYVHPRHQATLKPRANGWFSHKKPFDFSFGEIELAEGAQRFAGGTPSVASLYSARAGYEMIEQVGVTAIRNKAVRQTELLIQLADAQGLTVRSPRDSASRGNMVCVDFEESQRASEELCRAGFRVDWRPGSGIRLSPHFYTTDDECRAIMEEIRKYT